MFCDDIRVMDDRERWGIKIRTIWRIRVYISNQQYNLPDSVEKTSCRSNHPPYRDSYLPYERLELPYWGW
jgi:hypothetical protein